MGERLHKVLGQIDLGTLDSGERSLPFGILVLFIIQIDMLYIVHKYKKKLESTKLIWI